MESEGKGENEGKEATGTGRPIASKASRGGVLSYVQGHGQTASWQHYLGLVTATCGWGLTRWRHVVMTTVLSQPLETCKVIEHRECSCTYRHCSPYGEWVFINTPSRGRPRNSWWCHERVVWLRRYQLRHEHYCVTTFISMPNSKAEASVGICPSLIWGV